LWTIALAAPSTPTTGDGRVFVISDERLVAVSPDDGTIIWGLQLGGRPSASLRWDNGRLFAATQNAELFALASSDGHVQWRRVLAAALSAPAAPMGERVFVSLENGRVEALDIHTGETLWERPLDGTPTEILALPDRIFVGSKDNFFYCLDVHSGDVRWRWRTGADIIGSAVVDEDRVYFISLDNVLRALDRGGGGLRWHRGLPMRASSGPIMLQHVLIVPGVAAEFMAFNISDGIYIGSYRAAADLAAPPHLYVKPNASGAPTPEKTPETTDEESRPDPWLNSELIVITRDGGLEALVRAPRRAPAAKPPSDTPTQTAPGSPPAPNPDGQPAPDPGSAPTAPPTIR
jgi:outer membrane protein assembly factor BamB